MRARRIPVQLTPTPAVALARSGDREAIRSLYVTYRGAVYDYVLSMIRDPREAHEVTQHVFLKLMCVIDTYEPRQAPFVSWLRRVARTVALDYLRGHCLVSLHEVYAELQLAEDSARDRRRRFERALEVLRAEHPEGRVAAHAASLASGEPDGGEASVRGLRLVTHDLDEATGGGSAPSTHAAAS